jgi:hypothetical protein
MRREWCSMSGVTDLLDCFNWLDRVEGLVSALSNGGSQWTFEIPRGCGWTGGDIETFLDRYGVDVWGRRVRSDALLFSVKRHQANWAEYLLRRRGIPILQAPFNPVNEEYGRWYSPGSQPGDGKARYHQRRRWVDQLLSWLE